MVSRIFSCQGQNLALAVFYVFIFAPPWMEALALRFVSGLGVTFFLRT